MNTWRTTIHSPVAQRLGPRPDVVQDVGDRLHLGDRVVELGHAAPVGCVCESIRPGRTILPPRSTTSVLGPAGLEDLLVGPDAEQAAALDGQGLADREVAVDGDDLAVVEDQVGLLGPHGRAAEAERQEQASKPTHGAGAWS